MQSTLARMNDHLPGKPISASTYNYGCRCDGCRSKASANMRKYRKKGRTRLSMLATGRAKLKAASWVQKNHPEVWTEFKEQSLAELETERPWLAKDLRRG